MAVGERGHGLLFGPCLGFSSFFFLSSFFFHRSAYVLLLASFFCLLSSFFSGPVLILRVRTRQKRNSIPFNTLLVVALTRQVPATIFRDLGLLFQVAHLC